MNKDDLIKCNRCEGDACYTQKIGKIILYSCYGCGFQTSTVNLPQNGMVFATAAKEFGDKGAEVNQDNYEWAGVKAVKITEEEKSKFPIPGKKGEFYEWRMDMTTEKRFAHNDFVEALDYIDIFKEQ